LNKNQHVKFRKSNQKYIYGKPAQIKKMHYVK